MATIILVRHGENEWVKKNRLAGWIPGVHLNEKGHQQAQEVARRLAALPVKAVYSSPLTRCLETAAYVADTHQLALIQLEEVGEVRYGDWEGQKVKKLARKPEWRMVQFFPSRFRFPGGESLRDVQARAVQALEMLSQQHDKETIVVVSHADVIRLVLAHYLGVHVDLFQRLEISPGSATLLALPADGFVRILRINDDGPLRPPADKPGEEKKKKDKKSKKKVTVQHEATTSPVFDGSDEEE
jgi:probable phosphoglycerate mutase